ncbi:MAG: cytosine permease [Actinomycetota bacterium]|nr:cytosine permease [Actinomycetota bacterium]
MSTAPVPPGGRPHGAGRVEGRSIDYVPRAERHGRVWHQGPFWFMGNFVLVTMVTGFIGPSVGLSLGPSVLAIVLGVLFGTFFMAFHANQGPRMGLPQMIQSRAQFGLRGAAVPLLATVFVYIGFVVFDLILAKDALQTVLPGGKGLWYALLTIVAVAIAVVGHDLLHTVQRYLTYAAVLIFGVLTVGAIANVNAGAATPDAGFALTAFLTQFAAAAGYQISYAVYVSDYSRYLPSDTPARGVIGWTYLGAAASAIWLMCLGALIAGALPEPDPIASVRAIGNDVFDGFGTFVVLASVPALISIMAVNCYGAMLTTNSGVDGFRRFRPTVRSRIIGILAVAIVSLLIALVIPDDYLDSFTTFVLFMLYFLVPWTAVNLVDFYFVRRGHYAITEIFNPRGIYGRWGGPGLIAYAVGLLAMAPFIVTSFYTGPVAEALDGADISFAVGLVVAGVLYLVLARRIDLDREREAIRASERTLEG